VRDAVTVMMRAEEAFGDAETVAESNRRRARVTTHWRD
jgi:hypothetical protein